MQENEQSKLNELFEQLAAGQTPDFLQMMAAISEISTVYPEPEPACDGVRCVGCQ